MIREIRQVSTVVLTMFVALFVAASIIQVFQSTNLDADPRNTRELEASYRIQRGDILVAGVPVAESIPSHDRYHYQRVYPDGPEYSAVTGFLPTDGQPTGIEGALNSELSGVASQDPLTALIDTATGHGPAGDSVDLTLDPAAQKAAYDALGQYRGAAVVIQPSTGRILAMASTPSFDPNALASHNLSSANQAYNSLLDQNPDPLVDRAITGNLNPPGSTFKLVVAAAAFDSGKFSPNSALPNPARLNLPGTNTAVHNDTGRSCEGGNTTVSLTTALQYSCNIPYAELGMNIGPQSLLNQAQKFGFDQRQNIPIPVAESNFPLYTNQAQLAEGSFGQQDDRATPLQMAMVSSAIANHGVLMRPNLIQDMVTPDHRILDQFTPTVYDHATTITTADEITTMMTNDVSNGIAYNAQIPDIAVAGKTGTSQNGPGQPYSLWFTGFAPAASPEYAVAVVIENGGGKGELSDGNAIAAPIARSILETLLRPTARR